MPKHKKTLILILTILISLYACKIESQFPKEIDQIVYTKYTRDFTDSIPSTWGALNTHDPEIFQDDDGTYYVFSTDASIGNTWGGGVQVRTSTDLINWECLTEPALGKWDSDMKDWCGFETDSAASTWAPSVIKMGNKYLMYHGVIVDVEEGTRAWIGLAISDSVSGPYIPAEEYDPVTYQDSTIVRYTRMTEDAEINNCFNTGNNGWNTGIGAIDPHVMFDEAGQLWFVYGSWKGGIAILPLDNSTGMPSEGYPVDTLEDGAYRSGKVIAGGTGAAYEGVYILAHENYYYLFLSCGEDLTTQYCVRVGRCPISEGIDGTYYDAAGRDLTDVDYNTDHNVGNKVFSGYKFSGQYGWDAPGGQSFTTDKNGNLVMALHSRTDFKEEWFFYLQLHTVFFNDDGWPVVNPNEYYNDELQSISMGEFAGSYDVVLTETNETADEETKLSTKINLNSDGSIDGTYSGNWEIYDNYKINITLKNSAGSSIGQFNGYVLNSVDWSRMSDAAEVETLTFTTFSEEYGEYFLGNKDNK